MTSSSPSSKRAVKAYFANPTIERCMDAVFFSWDLQRDRLLLSSRWNELVGDSSKDPSPRRFLDLLNQKDRTSIVAAVKACRIGGKSEVSVECKVRPPNGPPHRIVFQGQVSGKRGGLLRGAMKLVAPADGISEGGLGEDPLTGLINDEGIHDAVNAAAQQFAHNERPYAVIALNLDRLRLINDGFGRNGGDLLLRTVANRLREISPDPVERDSSMNVRASTDLSALYASIVGRTGPDEFTLLLDAPHSDRNVIRIARRVLGVLDAPMSLDGRDVYISGRVGVVMCDPTYRDATQILTDVRTAVEASRAPSLERVQVFGEHMRADARERVSLESDLRQAVQDGQLELHYQSLVDARTGRTSGVEALLRWTHPERGRVSPAQMIPVAEETGLIVPMGDWILAEACSQQRKWADMGQCLKMSINVSPLQLEQPDFVEKVQAVLESTGVDPAFIQLEVTETALIGQASSEERLRELRRLGVLVALDDFGTGYSSLATLKHVPLDTLKMDRGFLEGILTDERDAAVARCIVELARCLRLRVVAEGVETAAQAAMLAKMGCHELQGYYFARPEPADVVEATIVDAQLLAS